MTKLQEELRQTKVKHQLAVDRYLFVRLIQTNYLLTNITYKQQIETLATRNRELEDELRYRENRRIDRWDTTESDNKPQPQTQAKAEKENPGNLSARSRSGSTTPRARSGSSLRIFSLL